MATFGELVSRAARVAASKTPPTPAPKMLDGLSGRGFVTARAGSSYVVHDDGTTTRTKAASPGHPSHQDDGVKLRSSRTFYLDDGGAALAGAMYAQGVSPLSGSKLKYVDIADSGPVLMVMQFERLPPKPGSGLPGAPVRELGYKAYPMKSQPEPAVGLSPFEVYPDGGMHLGSKITEVR